MSVLAPTLEAFFTQRLAAQRRASPNTIAAYRDTMRLLLVYLHDTAGLAPTSVDFADLDASRIAAFLDHLERDRKIAVTTRNARLAAIHSLFRYAALRHPEHAALIQRVLAIPPKRGQRRDVSFLNSTEIDALLSAPDLTTRLGRRDRALLSVAVQTGLRVSELVGLRRGDIVLGPGAHVRCTGKGRKTRSTPLTEATRAVLRSWLAECDGEPDAPLFPGPGGRALGRDAVRRILERHTRTAAVACPSLATKRLSPHVLRHTCAMQLLDAGVDSAVIALWLGHESVRTTDIYQHADLSLKERALARTASRTAKRGRYRAADPLLAFIERL